MGNMYSDSVKGVSNIFVGCKFDCIYCQKSFQAQMKRQMHNCQLCYQYTPHFHEERLKQSLPLTKGDEFIWLVRSGDPCFMSGDEFNKMLDLIKSNPTRTFLIQTKDPEFLQYHKYPPNCILGITLETDITKGYEKISRAPNVLYRADKFSQVEHSRKMVTIEPILRFTTRGMLEMIESINPERIYIGYDTKKTKGLPEPTLFQTRLLISILREKGYKVKEKYMKEDKNV